MELKGKKIVFLGDSITFGAGTSGEENTFVYLVGKYGGFRESLNYGISGTRIARQTKPTVDNPSFDLDFCQRVEELDDDADIVVVFGGTNDFGHGDASLGSFESRSLYTFYGACHHLMTRLHERFPGKPIIIMTPLHRLDEDVHRVDNGADLKVYVDIIREVAEYYSIPVLDLYSESGIQPKVKVLCDKYCPDGLHPNDDGHVILTNKILSYLKNM